MSTTPAVSIRAPVERITDVELTTLLKTRQARIFMDVVKSKKKGASDLYSQEFQWTDTKTPVLTKEGVVDAFGTAMWGVQAPEKRNTGEYAKLDSNFDECDMTFGTKYSGTFGELMCQINDVSFPEAVIEFTQRADQKELWAGHEIDPHQFCKKNAGSLKKPAPKEEQAAYTAAADWSFPVKLKIEKRTKTGEISNKPFMFRVVKYVLNNKGLPVEQEIKINSQTIHKELTRNSKLLLCMRPGNCSMKAATYKGSTINTFFPAFNFGHITVLKKGEFGGSMKADRPNEEIQARLAAAGVELTFGTTEEEDDEAGEPGDDSTATVSATPFKPGAVGASGDDLAAQFAKLNA
jgi:hypothetical protein